MGRIRVSLAGLMGMVLISGIAFAALRDLSESGAGVLLLVTLAILATAILGVVYRRDAKRAWWLGFGLYGWGYLTLAFGPWFSTEMKPGRGWCQFILSRPRPG